MFYLSPTNEITIVLGLLELGLYDFSQPLSEIIVH